MLYHPRSPPTAIIGAKTGGSSTEFRQKSDIASISLAMDTFERNDYIETVSYFSAPGPSSFKEASQYTTLWPSYEPVELGTSHPPW